jgi:hypothetical protein
LTPHFKFIGNVMDTHSYRQNAQTNNKLFIFLRVVVAQFGASNL